MNIFLLNIRPIIGISVLILIFALLYYVWRIFRAHQLSPLIDRSKPLKPIKFEEGMIKTARVFERGEEDYNCFRIPALISLPNNVFCAFAEGRRDSCSDLGNIDLVVKRSEDGGSTWGDFQTIWDLGYSEVQNPCPFYVEETQTLLVLVVGARKCPYIFRSKDLGKTWDGPEKIDIDYDQSWTFMGPSPGHGLILDSGRLLVSGMNNINEGARAKTLWGSFYMYSDDHGETWELGHVFPFETNECLSAQLESGAVCTILRPNYGGFFKKKYMRIAISSDGGETVDEVKIQRDLITPICQGSIISHENSLIYSGPNSARYRQDMTLKTSDDGGKTFEKEKLIYKGKSVYSDLAINENDQICCLFECGIDTLHEAIEFVVLSENVFEIIENTN